MLCAHKNMIRAQTPRTRSRVTLRAQPRDDGSSSPPSSLVRLQAATLAAALLLNGGAGAAFADADGGALIDGLAAKVREEVLSGEVGYSFCY
jgi:hypothetical protein